MRSASAPEILEGRSQHPGKNTTSVVIKTSPSPVRSKFNCISRQPFDDCDHHHWSLGDRLLFCGCISDDPIEREFDSRYLTDWNPCSNIPIEIHVKVETNVTSRTRWRNSTEALLSELYDPVVDSVSGHVYCANAKARFPKSGISGSFV